MEFYIFSFIFLSIPAIYEIEHYSKIKKENIFFLTPFLVFFIGLRDGIGCDWDGYLRNFNLYSNFNLSNFFSNNNFPRYLNNQEIGYAFFSYLIGNITKSFYIYNLILSLIFSIPLIYFCSKLKRPFLSLLISFPYFITIIGMGPLKQSIAISFLILAFIALESNNYIKYYLFNIISILFHRTAIIFTLLPFLIKDKSEKTNLTKNKFLILGLLIFIVISCIIQQESFIRLLKGYFIYRTSDPIINTFYHWTIICSPSIIYLFFRNKFKNLETKNNMWFILSISSVLIIIFTFINSTITLRMLLYFYPLKLLILSNFPEIKLFNISKKRICYLLIFFSIIQQITWLAFANHAYCWVPYKNIFLIN